MLLSHVGRRLRRFAHPSSPLSKQGGGGRRRGTAHVDVLTGAFHSARRGVFGPQPPRSGRGRPRAGLSPVPGLAAPAGSPPGPSPAGLCPSARRPPLKANLWQPLVVAVGGIGQGLPGRSDRRPLRRMPHPKARTSPVPHSRHVAGAAPRPTQRRLERDPLVGRDEANHNAGFRRGDKGRRSCRDSTISRGDQRRRKGVGRNSEAYLRRTRSYGRSAEYASLFRPSAGSAAPMGGDNFGQCLSAS